MDRIPPREAVLRSKKRVWTLRELAKVAHVHESTVRKALLEYCEMHSQDPHQFIKRELVSISGKVITVKKYVIPKEVAGEVVKLVWLRKHYYLHRVLGKGANDVTNMPEHVLTLPKLAQKLGVSVRKLRREFRWWCHLRGENPEDYLYNGHVYIPPREFVEYAERVFS